MDDKTDRNRIIRTTERVPLLAAEIVELAQQSATFATQSEGQQDLTWHAIKSALETGAGASE